MQNLLEYHIWTFVFIDRRQVRWTALLIRNHNFKLIEIVNAFEFKCTIYAYTILSLCAMKCYHNHTFDLEQWKWILRVLVIHPTTISNAIPIYCRTNSGFWLWGPNIKFLAFVFVCQKRMGRNKNFFFYIFQCNVNGGSGVQLTYCRRLMWLLSIWIIAQIGLTLIIIELNWLIEFIEFRRICFYGAQYIDFIHF